MKFIDIIQQISPKFKKKMVKYATKTPLKRKKLVTFKTDDLGTLIIGVNDMEIYKPVTGVAADTSQARIVICDVPDKPGTAGKLFSLLKCPKNTA